MNSIFAQNYAAEFELILVDNDPGASAAGLMQELSKTRPKHITLTCLHEAEAGVANARNCAMDRVTTRLVAFLDDDQSAPTGWLTALLANHAEFPAAVTFGPVETALPETVTQHRAYFSDFFARTLEVSSGFIETYFGCGNALFDLSKLPNERPLFDPRMNASGGEDDMLFARIQKDGARFAWCADAPVFEHVPTRRAALSYTLKRAFSYGQGPVTMALKATPKRYGAFLFWIMVGFAKTLSNGLIFAALFMLRDPSRVEYLDRTARGLGKVLWGIDLNFYGTALLEKKRPLPVRKQVSSPTGNTRRSA